jgi:hypothetical protein
VVIEFGRFLLEAARVSLLVKECALIGRLQQKAFGAESLHNVQAVFGPDLVLAVVQVVLHGLLRQAEVIRAFPCW